jgi:hypothetical protein
MATKNGHARRGWSPRWRRGRHAATRRSRVCRFAIVTVAPGLVAARTDPRAAAETRSQSRELSYLPRRPRSWGGRAPGFRSPFRQIDLD